MSTLGRGNLFARALEGVTLALQAVRASKVRAALTILGIAIGVMVVIAMASMITSPNVSWMLSDSEQNTSAARQAPKRFSLFRPSRKVVRTPGAKARAASSKARCTVAFAAQPTISKRTGRPVCRAASATARYIGKGWALA